MTPSTAPPAGVKGAYCLALHLPRRVQLSLPRFGTHTFRPGWYLYFGSAYGPGGLKARLARHLRREKAAHWHVDHLTVKADRLECLAFPGGDECSLRARFEAALGLSVPLAGFGSSDCRKCSSHLLQWEGGGGCGSKALPWC